MGSAAHAEFSGRRVFVVGCGYLGSAVAQAVQARGAVVTALTRNPTTAAALRDRGIEVLIADAAETSWHAAAPRAADFVLNALSSGGGGLEAYHRSYILGLQSLLAWAAGADRVGTLVYTSSTSVYPQDGGATVDEESPTAAGGDRPGILAAAERLALAAPAGVRRTFVLRLAGIYGPGRLHLVDQVRAGEVSGVGTHRLNLAHRDDIVAAILAAWTAPANVSGGVFNIADDGAAPKHDVVQWLAQRLGVPPPRFTGQPAGARRRVTPDRVIANHRAKVVLGWSPRYPTFREGYGAVLGESPATPP